MSFEALDCNLSTSTSATNVGNGSDGLEVETNTSELSTKADKHINVLSARERFPHRAGSNDIRWDIKENNLIRPTNVSTNAINVGNAFNDLVAENNTSRLFTKVEGLTNACSVHERFPQRTGSDDTWSHTRTSIHAYPI